mmetsp:Transcript_11798/g.18120  ORF Transcript_11798/g.18120 Transcript_11798/m.18120 type:complete len:103 (+) Transcript_11798:1235-1543(+)
MTFFPINLPLLPFIIPLILLRSESLSLFVLRFQYLIIALFYFVAGMLLAIVTFPFFFIKLVLNAAYSNYNSKQSSYKYQGLANFFISVVGGVPLILVSILAD